MYNDELVYFEDNVIPWDDRFIGNTSINYNDELIAIWKVNSSYENINILTSKIIHEMFHAFQNEKKELRWPNEIEAKIKYNYNDLNLSIKHEENLILYELLEKFEVEKLKKFLILRKNRKEKFNYEFNYESMVEVIEGMAEYVELKSLQLMSEVDYNNSLLIHKNKIININNLFPIRSISYNIGALICLIAFKNNIDIYHEIGKESYNLTDLMSKKYELNENIYMTDINSKIKDLRINFIDNNIKLVTDFINSSINHHELKGYKLAGFDPYNAVANEDKIYCPNFYALITNTGEVDIKMETAVLVIGDKMDVIEVFVKI